MCSPVRASQIAHALKLPRVAVLRRLQEMVKHGYVERVGNAYRVTDKVNIPDLQTKLQRRIPVYALVYSGAFANGQCLQEDAGLQHLLCGTGRSGRI
jgi:DNA-binding transcriptional regulator LsrR (DeoR family)